MRRLCKRRYTSKKFLKIKRAEYRRKWFEFKGKLLSVSVPQILHTLSFLARKPMSTGTIRLRRYSKEEIKQEEIKNV